MRFLASRFATLIFSTSIGIHYLLAQQVMLRYLYHPGEAIAYKTVTRISQTGEFIRDAVITIEDVTRYTIQKVHDDSSADITMTIESVDARFFKEKFYSNMDELKGVPILIRRASSGKYVDVKPAEDVSSRKRKIIDGIRVNFEFEGGFPDRPLALGETWESSAGWSFDMEETRFDLQLKRSLKFVGFQDFAGVKCAVISMRIDVGGTVTTPFEEVPIKGSGRGTLFFDFGQGKVMQQATEYEGVATISHKKGPMNLRTKNVTRSEIVR
ncbi:MAG TPA: hypothetical protein VNN76_08845 [Bacteroidota bacterium]|nr:hypothetical protein [Bacteroidota bacterium]